MMVVNYTQHLSLENLCLTSDDSMKLEILAQQQ
jgi:hypothetical protein